VCRHCKCLFYTRANSWTNYCSVAHIILLKTRRHQSRQETPPRLRPKSGSSLLKEPKTSPSPKRWLDHTTARLVSTCHPLSLALAAPSIEIASTPRALMSLTELVAIIYQRVKPVSEELRICRTKICTREVIDSLNEPPRMDSQRYSDSPTFTAPNQQKVLSTGHYKPSSFTPPCIWKRGVNFLHALRFPFSQGPSRYIKILLFCTWLKRDHKLWEMEGLFAHMRF